MSGKISDDYIELEADVEERLKRNKSANRLKHKPSKRNFRASEEELLETDKNYDIVLILVEIVEAPV